MTTGNEEQAPAETAATTSKPAPAHGTPSKPPAGHEKPAWGRELAASLVVFLVALPLCMGIAIASGVPPALGLISGIIGGIVVGSL